MPDNPVVYYLIYIALFSVITFVAYGIDKVKAKAFAWRTPEKTLLALSFFGGAIGGLLGMKIFRHKTKHWYFTLINYFSAFLHLGILYLLLFVI